MSYKFNFNLSELSQSFFREIAKFSYNKNIHRNMGKTARYLVEKFKVNKIIGIPVSDAITLVEDMIDTYTLNLSMREDFEKTERRALLLPHCSRKHMDNKCQAYFDTEMSSYRCMGCSDDCLINIATKIAKKKGYDVYVLPGGSCIRKIIKGYDGVVGVACTEEICLTKKLLKLTEIKAQSVPLLKNGCADTMFNMETLKEII